ncbi:hypothetical protein BLNAU_22218 [Blattamonas nauphoetae]|uniref:Protein kinase domain-containing protein n=1 Tax=Blattamonas nauphoetae TaxID=2049346 RepID=A0ABQ9WTN5_9EUKA|nr:hypothetical protein BLNAU_22218 [Blattamonas nauphoetae]
MFDVSNSTFSVKGIHANCKSGRNGLCSISASQVRTFDSEAFQSGSSIPLLGVTHLSNTHALPPLAGLLHPSTMLSSAFNSDLNDISLDIDAGVSVVGMGLVLASTSFLAGTGPLLSFGLSEDQPLPDVVHSQRMETMLIGCKLMNVTSRRVGRREEVMVGREVSQQLIGSAVCRSVNHASGTGMMDGNLGGNVRCVNTSFRECRREGNSDPSFFNTNMTQTATGRQVFDASCTATLARLEEHCRLAWRSIAGSLGGALQARLEEHCRLAWRSSADAELLSVSAGEGVLLQHCQSTVAGDDGGGGECLGDENGRAVFPTRAVLFLGMPQQRSLSQCRWLCPCYEHSVSLDGRLLLCAVDCIERRSAHSLRRHTQRPLQLRLRPLLCHELWMSCGDSRDSNSRLLFPTDNFTHCDTTSDQPNVFFQNGSKSDSDLVPLVTSPPTPTISAIDIQFDEERMLATVSVTASGEIGGTMGILLDGLIVPRLIHVTFGSETELSRSGSAVVSSGPLGVLPKANYTAVDQSFAAVFLAPRIIDCVCSLKDANTSVIVVSGWELEEGNYVMEFTEGQDGDEKEISLTWVNTWTLEGTALLYPSEAEGRLDWETEFEVRSVVRRTPSEDTTIELSRTLQFTTPKEPIRIEGADCSLDGEKEKSGVVEFWGECLSSGDEYSLKVKREVEGVVSGEVIELNGTLSSESESGSFLHTEEIFGTSSPHVSFGETYLVVGIVVGGVDGVVNGDIRFSVPAEPSRLTKITASAFTNNDKTQIELSFDVHALKANTVYKMILQSIVGEGKSSHEKAIELTTNETGDFETFSVILYPIEIDETTRKGQLDLGTDCKAKSIEHGSIFPHIETTDTSFSTPDEPVRVEACVSQQLSNDWTKLTLLLTGRMLTSPLVSVCLSNGSHKWLPLSPIIVENDTHCSVEFLIGNDEDASLLAFVKEYTLQDGESAAFVVHSEVVVSVPRPPTVREMKFSFANDVHTSCVVELFGNDLVASTEYNMTLNSSLWMIVQFVSSTSGKSELIEIGWGGGLQFNAEYTATSLIPLCVDDGDILVVGSLSAETGKRPSSFNIFVDSSSLEGSPFCGDLSRACSSMPEVWKIVSGLVIVRPTIEIVDSVRMNDGIRIVGGMHAVIRNGTSSDPSLLVPSSFSLDSLSAVIVVEATGFLEIRNVDVLLESSDPSFVFLSATQATIILREGIISGPTTPSFTHYEDDGNNLCSWTTGALHLTNCSMNVSDTKLTHLSQGVINMKGGTVSFVSSLFSDNTPSFEPFSSFRRNLICSDNGSIDVGSLTGGDGMLDHPHLWMATDGCTMTGEYSKPLSPLFIPTLSNTSTSSFDKKKELFEVEVKGSTLIPCGLSLEVFEMMKNKKEGENERFQLSNNTTTSFTETSVRLTLPSSSLISLRSELEWRGRLIFGNNQQTDTTFVIQLSRTEKLAESVKENMKWWLPLAIVLTTGLLVVVVIVVLCVWRRKKSGGKEDMMRLMVTHEMEVEKYEVMDDDAAGHTVNISSIRGLNENTLNTEAWTEKRLSDSEKKEEEKEMEHIPFENRVCGLSCGEKSGVVSVVDKTETLYRRLHVLKLGVDRRWAQLSVSRGLPHAMGMTECSAILTELTSHSVVVSGERTMSLIVKGDTIRTDAITEQATQLKEEVNENPQKQVDETDTSLNFAVADSEQKLAQPQPPQIARPHPLHQNDEQRDDVRWQAPEEGKENEDEMNTNKGQVRKEIDRAKASLFRLGLILWEIETGNVPFSELDGVNAHRNLSVGIVPKMDGVGEKMRGLIEECLSVNPDKRPSVELVISRLSLMDGKESTQKAQHIALS